MSLIKGLNYNELKIKCQNKIKKDVNFPKVINKVNEIYFEVQKILSNSKNGKKNNQKLDELKSNYKENMFKKMVDVISEHLEYYNPCNNIELANDSGEKNGYYLQPVTEGYIKPSNPNQYKIFMLRATSPNSILPIDLTALHPEAYNKFEKFMFENPDATDWFGDFLNEVRNYITENDSELKKYILMLYENLSKEKRIKLLDDIGKEDEEYIINFIKIVPEIWIHFFKIV